MAKHFSILVVLFIIGCTARHGFSDQSNQFVEYVNDNKSGMKLDGVLVQDQSFKLKIPPNLQNVHKIVGGSFLQILNFKDDQKIVLLYAPFSKASSSIKLTGVSYRAFQKICETENIASEFNKIDIKGHRQFGIYKPGNKVFYAIYLNIKTINVEAFNYAINSIEL